MLKRLGILIGFVFFWFIAALVFPIVFWVISAAILTATIIHIVRAGEFHSPGKLFVGVGVATALVATLGFFVQSGGPDDYDLDDDAAIAAAMEAGEDAAEDAQDAAEDAADDAEDAGEDVAEAVEDSGDDASADAAPVDSKAVIKAAMGVAKKPKDCKSLETVAAAWKELARVAVDDPVYKKAKAAAKGLEKCRKKAATALSKGQTKDRVKARNVLVKEVKTNLADAGLKLKPKAQGKAKDALLLRGRKLTEEQIDAAFAAGSTEDGTVLGRLQAAGFTKVTVQAGKVKREFALEPSPDDAAALEELASLGMGDPLQLP